ncbi:UNVERIFIED_CONTAM: E3 ubiquitin-protein ligase WAV3 [Sesamum latifolium]|uniref:E3 ubiquitin-protein ligase WAV3 n=1 Tax=Sesamum latifolium TaxID=2727402 RepID=A0AAW2Y395_9LAMI
MVGSKWMKVKIALGLKLNSCLYVPSTVEDSPTVAVPPMPARFSDAVSLSPTPPRDSDHRVQMPHHAHAHARLPPALPCLDTLQISKGKMERDPFQSPTTDKSHERARINNVSWAQENNTWTPGIRRNPSPRVDVSRQVATLFQAAEPDVFDDDEEVDSNQPDVAQSSSSSNNSHQDHFSGAVEVKTYPEVSAVPKSNSHDNFSVLIHLKAPITTARQHSDGASLPLISQTSRAPVDLVTVLDVSGSMAGTKLALLKRAMGFVIQNLGPSDRLSVIAFLHSTPGLSSSQNDGKWKA